MSSDRAPQPPSPADPSAELGAVRQDLGLSSGELASLGQGPAQNLLAVGRAGEPLAADFESRVAAELAPGGFLLLLLEDRDGARLDDRELARVRNGLWPLLHVVALYRLGAGHIRCRTLDGSREVEGLTPLRGVLLVARRRTWVLSPEATVQKFDLNARGWDGQPGTPGYAHFRWMRRHVGLFAPAPGPRILDFGCGAGWCGIEAARRVPGACLCVFDPSPQMVAIAGENARAAGIQDFTGRTGFGEDPPHPGPEEAPFDLVLSSGVISFAPDPEPWLDGLARTVRAGGTLVVGDIQRDALGFRQRRATRPLLPTRELNACAPAEVRAALEARGFVHERTGGYQLTRPVPQLMYLSETRLGGLLSLPLLWTNRLATTIDRALGTPLPALFDSWVMRLRRN
ncbi:MAG: class I SAM-dependent methyltransferase [Planctomycetota bacterium]